MKHYLRKALHFPTKMQINYVALKVEKVKGVVVFGLVGASSARSCLKLNA